MLYYLSIIKKSGFWNIFVSKAARWKIVTQISSSLKDDFTIKYLGKGKHAHKYAHTN